MIKYFSELIITEWTIAISFGAALFILISGSAFYSFLAFLGIFSVRAVISIILNRPRNFPIISGIFEGICFVSFIILINIFFRTM